MKKQTAENIIQILSTVYDDKPALNYSTAYELLVAVILSAQCTDERVNKVTKTLFKEYSTPEKMLSLSQEELEKKIYSCGLYRSKAKHILSASKDIMDKFDGTVPNKVEPLRTLAGVGRKTANVVYSVYFKGDAIAVDTHVFRVANRMGLVKADSVLKTELQLNKILDKKVWSKAHHYLIYHGRRVCKASKPDCENCIVSALCEKNIKKRK